MTLLSLDSDHRRALRAGWKEDRMSDGLWFVREMRGGDVELNEEQAHIGFTVAGEVFVCSAVWALAYDRGEIQHPGSLATLSLNNPERFIRP